MHRHRFFCQEPLLFNEKVALSIADSHHCENVLRLGIGECVHLFNGTGLACIGEICSIKDGIVKLVIKEVSPASSKKQDIILACGWLKAQKNELIVQKCTELGIQNFIFLQMDNCVAKCDEKKIDRLRKIALEACKQSGRTTLPRVEAAQSIENGLESLRDRRLLWVNENEQENFLLDFIEGDYFCKRSPLAFIIGPEGGFSKRESVLLKAENCFSTSLGFDSVLRSETAAIAVTAFLTLHAMRGNH